MKSVVDYRRRVDELDMEIIELQELLGEELSARDYRAMKFGALMAERNVTLSILHGVKTGQCIIKDKEVI